MARLIIESGATPREVPIGDVCRIGRDKANELQIDDPGASRRHCRIAREGDQYILEDLKSANGTQRNDMLVDRVVLEDGDVVQVGATRLRFSIADAGGAADVDEIRLEDPAEAGARFELAFVTGERAAERVKIAGDKVTLGRRGSNTVVFKDSKVSGVHAEVAVEGGRVVLRDLGSTNGTFLEGKRIDEIPLDHGDRVSVGDSEFVLVDTTRPEPDLTAGGFDAEQTIVDMPKVKVVRDVSRTGRSPVAALGLVAVVLGLGGATWFWWNHRPQGTVPVDVPPAAGNMLAASWSLESLEDAPDPGDLWTSVGEAPSFAVVVGESRTGLQHLSAVSGEEGALSELRDPLPCTSRSYRVEGYARTEGGASARIVAVFADESGREAAIPVGSAESASWEKIEGEVVPPTGAKTLRLRLVGAFAGRVRFDDLGVFEGGMARPESREVNQFGFERTGPVLATRWAGQELLRFRGPEFVDAAGAAWPVGTWGSGGEAGRAAVGEGHAQYSTALAEESAAVTWNVEWRDAAAAEVVVPLVLSGALLEEPVGVLRGEQLDPYEDSFDADGVSGLVVGRGGDRMRVQIAPPARVSGRRGATDFELRLAVPVAAGRVSLRTQVDFRDEKVEAARLLASARDAEARGALGQALNELARIENEFPFDEVTLAEAERRRAGIQNQRDALLKELREKEERAGFLRSPTAFADAQAVARRGAESFAGTESAAAFESVGRDLAVAAADADRASQRREADLLLQRMRTALSQDPRQERVAREIRDYLQTRYPWSDAAKAAVTEIED